jgi:hypothetical protein
VGAPPVSWKAPSLFLEEVGFRELTRTKRRWVRRELNPTATSLSPRR